MGHIKINLIDLCPETRKSIYSKTLEEHKSNIIKALEFAQGEEEIKKVLCAGLNMIIAKGHQGKLRVVKDTDNNWHPDQEI